MEILGMNASLFWLALAVVLIIAEMATLTFFLLWPAIAALVVAILAWVMPNLGLNLELLIFALISVALLFPGRNWAKKWRSQSPSQKLNSRSKRLIGDVVEVSSVSGKTYRVKHGDTEWAARSDHDFKKGDHALIVETDGNTLLIAPK